AVLLGESFPLGLRVWVAVLRLSTAARSAKWSSMFEADATTAIVEDDEYEYLSAG
ncbi:hypothetical protein BGZ68_003589, partial [Mortierella alpina]